MKDFRVLICQSKETGEEHGISGNEHRRKKCGD